jgi:hypothetical protein
MRPPGDGPPGPENDDARPKPGHAAQVVATTNTPATIEASGHSHANPAGQQWRCGPAKRWTNDIGPLTDDDFVVDQDAGPYTKAQARRVTNQIKLDLLGLWFLIVDAYKGRAWAALGYSSWDEYCNTEFGTTRLRLPREERAEVVASLRESGLSIRAIASATGVSYGTIQAEVIKSDHVDQHALAEEGLIATAAPPIIGIDGKTYPAQPPTPKTPRRKNASPAESKPSDRPGATRYSKAIQQCSASLADVCESLTDEQLGEALGAAQWLYELLRGETIIRQGKVVPPETR